MKQLIARIREASEITRTLQQRTSNEQFTKGDRTPVTVADFTVQAFLAKDWHRDITDVPLVSEEGADSLTSQEDEAILEKITEVLQVKFPEADQHDILNWIDRGNQKPSDEFWTLDPIDGTKGFIRGDQYCIALAHIRDGTVQTGILACPNLRNGDTEDASSPGTLVVAREGEGCWRKPLFEEGEKVEMSVSNTDDTHDALVLRSFESAHTDEELMQTLLTRLETQQDPWPMDSQAKYAALATGSADILYRLLSKKKPDYKEKIWDQAAGSIITEEAGGNVTDLHGNALDFSTGIRLTNNTGVLATNGTLHQKALHIYQKSIS